MASSVSQRYQKLQQVTHQVFLVVLGLTLVATLGFIIAIFSGTPIVFEEGLKLLWVYLGLGIVSLIRWLVGHYTKQPDGH